MIRVVKHDTELELFLTFKTTNADTAATQWKVLKDNFASLHSGSIADELYAKFIHFMEIPPEQGNIQIYVLNASGDYNKCLHIFLWDENGVTQTEEILNECNQNLL